jgi:hypothetical protein
MSRESSWLSASGSIAWHVCGTLTAPEGGSHRLRLDASSMHPELRPRQLNGSPSRARPARSLRRSVRPSPQSFRPSNRSAKSTCGEQQHLAQRRRPEHPRLWSVPLIPSMRTTGSPVDGGRIRRVRGHPSFVAVAVQQRGCCTVVLHAGLLTLKRQQGATCRSVQACRCKLCMVRRRDSQPEKRKVGGSTPPLTT